MSSRSLTLRFPLASFLPSRPPCTVSLRSRGFLRLLSVRTAFQTTAAGTRIRINRQCADGTVRSLANASHSCAWTLLAQVILVQRLLSLQGIQQCMVVRPLLCSGAGEQAAAISAGLSAFDSSFSSSFQSFMLAKVKSIFVKLCLHRWWLRLLFLTEGITS